MTDLFNNLLEEAAEQTQGGGIGTWILLGVVLVGVIALFIWQSISNKKKRKQAQEQLDSIRRGDRVKTIGGVCGFIVEINNEENTFVLETGTKDNKSYVKFDKAAIYQTSHVGEDNKETPIEEPVEKVEEKPEEKDAFAEFDKNEEKKD